MDSNAADMVANDVTCVMRTWSLLRGNDGALNSPATSPPHPQCCPPVTRGP